jgi:hypothetical protein
MQGHNDKDQERQDMNTDNTQGGAEPSPASAGSHGKVTVSVHTDDSACAFPDSRPIRRQRFTLTDAEREAMQFAAFLYEQGGRADDAATLRGLLERMK